MKGQFGRAESIEMQFPLRRARTSLESDQKLSYRGRYGHHMMRTSELSCLMKEIYGALSKTDIVIYTEPPEPSLLALWQDQINFLRNPGR